ncbi:MAG TPA: hypothetical protein ENH82_01775 [bacterium]|nr:hypothetical protein [bacterium]
MTRKQFIISFLVSLPVIGRLFNKAPIKPPKGYWHKKDYIGDYTNSTYREAVKKQYKRQLAFYSGIKWSDPLHKGLPLKINRIG